MPSPFTAKPVRGRARAFDAIFASNNFNPAEELMNQTIRLKNRIAEVREKNQYDYAAEELLAKNLLIMCKYTYAEIKPVEAPMEMPETIVQPTKEELAAILWHQILSTGNPTERTALSKQLAELMGWVSAAGPVGQTYVPPSRAEMYEVIEAEDATSQETPAT